MPDLESLADHLAQTYLDADQDRAGEPRVPLARLSNYGRTYYREQAALPMGVFGAWLAAREAEPCPPLPFTGGMCRNPEPLPHDYCWGATCYVADAHDRSEARSD